MKISKFAFSFIAVGGLFTLFLYGCNCGKSNSKPVPVPDRIVILETITKGWAPTIFIVRDTHTGDEYMIAHQTGIIKLTASDR